MWSQRLLPKLHIKFNYSLTTGEKKKWKVSFGENALLKYITLMTVSSISPLKDYKGKGIQEWTE